MKTLIQSQRDFFNTNQTKSIDFRITQLLKLRKLLQANEQILNEESNENFEREVRRRLRSDKKAMNSDVSF
jgi:aldehyde dehydrogenase (NAD+)